MPAWRSLRPRPPATGQPVRRPGNGIEPPRQGGRSPDRARRCYRSPLQRSRLHVRRPVADRSARCREHGASRLYTRTIRSSGDRVGHRALQRGSRRSGEVEMSAFIVELPNSPGSLAMLSEAVAERGINITGAAGATAGQVGSMAFTTDDDAATRTVLGERGWVYREVAVVTARVEDRPGTLAAAARRLADAGVNIETMFLAGMDGSKVRIAFGVDNAEAAGRALG